MNNGVAAMNAVGGPVGGMPTANNGIQAAGRPEDSLKIRLNTYIYDYFIKNELYDCARALVRNDVPLELNKTSPGRRRDADGNLLNNGVDDSAMDTDIKEEADSKRPDDLPVPSVPNALPQNSFLYDWFSVFFEVFAAQRSVGKAGETGVAVQYLQHTQQQQRQHLLRQMNPAMMPNQYQTMMRLQNGMNVPQNELPRKAMQNSSRNATPAQIQMAKNQQFMQHQMQREPSNVDMNGEQRPQSPSSAENAPSPSKRPRLENGAFNGQTMGPNGRGQPQGMHGGQLVGAAGTAQAIHANQILMQSGINPNNLGQPPFNGFQQPNHPLQQQALHKLAQNNPQHNRAQLNNPNLNKAMPNAAGVQNHGSPMMQQVADGAGMNNINMGEYYAGNTAGMRMPPSGQTGGNALQDYQVQLMLLEQHNKKRLIMARDEQDRLVQPDNRVLHGQQAFQGMSPQATRSGQSPTPQDQAKRGTPKMSQAGLPGSPLPDGALPKARGSPAGMGLHPGQVPPGMNPAFMPDMADVKPGLVAQNGAMMRPPSSHPAAFAGQQLNQQQMEALARSQAVARQGWQQHMQQAGPAGAGPMMQQPPNPAAATAAAVAAAAAGGGQQPQPVETTPQPQPQPQPQQRNPMPPPPALPANNNNNNGNNNGGNGSGRTQPPSPQQQNAAAPPTPQQSNKPNPKAKKDGKDANRKRPAKKGSTTTLNSGPTPSSEAEAPPTPTPSTPITPVHPSSFNAPKGAAANAGQMAAAAAAVAANNSQAPTSAPTQAAQIPQPPPPDPTQVAPFGAPDGTEGAQFNLDFASLDTNDVLGTFDFDAFLNTDDPGAAPISFDVSAPSGYGNPDGVEAGTDV